ncbi:MAG: hypothetical protein EOP62_13165 [Sphingomonadales bacterium]|nr:MAG: hypothetical protein EOP62_13165 [Sphingomonadales bacterium]
MYLVLFPFIIAQLVILARLANNVPLGLKSRWVHPFNLLGVLIFITLIDFGFLFYDLSDAGFVRPSGFNLSLEGARSAFIYFFLWSTMAVGVLFYASDKPQKSNLPKVVPNLLAGDIVFAIGAALSGITAIFVIVYSISMGDLLYVAVNRTTFFADNALAFIGVSFLVPSYIFLMFVRGFSKVTVAAGIGCLLLQSLMGQRGDPILITLFVAYLVSLTRGKLQAPFIYIILPVGAWLITILGYLYRFSGQFLNFSDYISSQDGWMGLFRGNDVALSESYTSVFSSQALLHREWYESFLGAVMALVPRELVPWKPFGASTQYTMIVDPQAWELYRRELVIGGPANMYLDFGFIGGAIVTALLFYAWGRVIVRANRMGTGTFWGPVAILSLYSFGRNDLYSVGLVLWPLIIIGLIYLLISKITGPFSTYVKNNDSRLKYHARINRRNI